MSMNRDTGVRAWDGVFQAPLRGRLPKPRPEGLTMVMDKGLGMAATLDLLELGAPYIDFIKLAFGTSAFYTPALLRKKIALIRSFGVDPYPGGTFLEVALMQGRLGRYLSQAKELGFQCVEISDGTVPLSPSHRVGAIKMAVEHGLRVIAEVGKKDPAGQTDVAQLREQVEVDLDAGAERVIVEGRESGKGVGIYDQQGNVKTGAVQVLVEGLSDPGALIWEAPEKGQQQELILRFGPNVNLGNIAPGEVLALEALRTGLRGDTLKAVLKKADSAT